MGFKSAVIASTFLISVSTLAGSPTKLKVMSYNLQNLFDTKDSSDTNDSEFTPNGAQKWTERVLADKIDNLAKVISAENPDFVGVSEVETAEVLEQLQKALRPAGYIVSYAGPSDDFRGIRCGVISKLPILSTNSHKVWSDTWTNPEGGVQKTRDILEVNLDASGASSALSNPFAILSPFARDAFRGNREGGSNQVVTLLVNHWPSRAGGPVRDVYRTEVAQKATSIISDILTQNPDRLVVSVGDYNDELDSPSFVNGLKLTSSYDALRSAPVGSVFATDSELPKNQSGTFFYRRESKWNALDHILVAQGPDLLSRKSKGFSYVSGSIQVVRPRDFMEKGQFPAGCELRNSGRTESGKRCGKGASDHLALTAEFELN